MKSILYCHNVPSLTSPDSIASTAFLPIIVAATMAGPMPPASNGFGIQAESPTNMYPFATRQSFCLLTETCQLPVALMESLESSDNLGFFSALKNPRLSDDSSDSINATGNWQVSVRRQNDCLVANGYMLVGDSAWMPKPLDAGGIGPAIVAATIIGKNAVEAIESGDVSEGTLWQYNIDFINDYGYKTAGLEIFRRLLQTLTNEQINYGMKHFLSKLDVDAISKGEHPDFGTVGKLGLMIRGALNKKLADGLRFTAQQNKILTEHYHDFPRTPDGYEAWHRTLHHILDESYTKLGN